MTRRTIAADTKPALEGKVATTPARTAEGGLPDGIKTKMQKDGKVRIHLRDGPSNPFAGVGGSKVPHFNSTMLRQAIGAVWMPPDAGNKHDQIVRLVSSTIAASVAFKPTNEIEGMMAAQAVALHFGAMECFRRSMIPEQSGEVASRLRRDGANLSRAMVELVDAIDRRRGMGPKQVVRVERVVVQDGGQAIVGNVTPARREPEEGGA